jgi:hypothetical protein
LLDEPVESFIWNNDARFFGFDGGIGKILEEESAKLQIAQTRGHTAGFPSEHFVMAWNKVDFPTFASPT